MSIINGMTTVNGGKVVDFENTQVEVLGPGISGHREYMVVAYMKEGSRKVSICFNNKAFFVYRFKNYADLQHYWSTKVEMDRALSSRKYQIAAKFLIRAYNGLMINK